MKIKNSEGFVIKGIMMALAIITILNSLLMACSKHDASSKGIIDNRPLGYGNTPSNIRNGGHFAQDESYIYYCLKSSDDISGLYKMNLNTEKAILLENSHCSNINVWNSWVYYVNNDDNNHVYKINVDGQNNLKLNDIHRASELIAVNGKLYFLTLGNRAIYVMNTDGTNLRQITDFGIADMYIQNNVIYFVKYIEHQACIYKMSIDGANQTLLHNVGHYGNIYNIFIHNDYMYYSDNSISRISINGGEKETVADKCAMGSRINFHASTLYYAFIGAPLDSRGIHALNLETGEDRIITNKFSNETYIINNQFYFLEEYNGKETYYVMNLDGSNLKEFGNTGTQGGVRDYLHRA